MHAGISSQLISVKNGIALLEVEIHSGWKKPNEVTAKQFIESWSNHNPDLKEVDGWEVRIFTSEKIAGFTISPKALNTPDLQKKIDLMNANPERYLVYIYKAYKYCIQHPIFTIKDSNKMFYLEYATKVMDAIYGYLDINSVINLVVFNKNKSGNLFINSPWHDDFILLATSECGDISEIHLLNASTPSMTYSFYSKLLFLINLSKEESARLFWSNIITRKGTNKIIVGRRN
jgi:hypothetical protein